MGADVVPRRRAVTCAAHRDDPVDHRWLLRGPRDQLGRIRVMQAVGPFRFRGVQCLPSLALYRLAVTSPSRRRTLRSGPPISSPRPCPGLAYHGNGFTTSATPTPSSFLKMARTWRPLRERWALPDLHDCGCLCPPDTRDAERTAARTGWCSDQPETGCGCMRLVRHMKVIRHVVSHRNRRARTASLARFVRTSGPPGGDSNPRPTDPKSVALIH